MGRKCYTIELDPAYVDVIVERFSNAYPDVEINYLPGAALG
jgi:DNA modification methylase